MRARGDQVMALDEIPPPSDRDAPPDFRGGGDVIPLRRSNTNAAATLKHNLAAEAQVVGGLLLHPKFFRQLESLETDDFYDPRHRAVWSAYCNLDAEGAPFDVAALEVELEGRGHLDGIGGLAFLGQLALKVPTTDNILYYAGVIRECRRERDLVLASADASADLAAQRITVEEMHERITRSVAEAMKLPKIGETALEKPRWNIPLVEIVGVDEPDDNDDEDWLLRDIAPRCEFALLAGPPKSGKTWMMLDLAIALARGEHWLGGVVKNTLGRPARVLVLALEDAKRRLAKRIWQLCRQRGTSPHDPLVADHLRVTRARLRLPDDSDLAAFERELDELKPDLVIVDCLSRVMLGNQNATEDATAFTQVCTDLCRDHDTGVLMMHHTRKPPSGEKKNDTQQQDPFDRIRGSGDFLGAARHAMLLEPLTEDDSEEHVSCLRGRGNIDLQRSSFAIEFVRGKNDSGRRIVTLVDRGDPKSFRAEISESKKEEKRVSKDSETRRRYMTALEIAKDRGFVSKSGLAMILSSEPTAQRTLAQLRKLGLIGQSGRDGSPITDAGLAYLAERGQS